MLKIGFLILNVFLFCSIYFTQEMFMIQNKIELWYFLIFGMLSFSYSIAFLNKTISILIGNFIVLYFVICIGILYGFNTTIYIGISMTSFNILFILIMLFKSGGKKVSSQNQKEIIAVKALHEM